MNRLPLIALALTFVAGCGYSEDKFADDYSAAMCDSFSACEANIVASYTDAGMDEATAQATFDASADAYCASTETEDGETDDTESECDFDSSAAQECVDTVEAISCDQWVDMSAFDALLCVADVCQ